MTTTTITATTTVTTSVPATAVTRQVISLAGRAGLRPHVEAPYRGAYRIVVNAPGRDGLFGAITVGARTGRILRAHLTRGNDGQERRYDTVAAIRAAIRQQAAAQAPAP